MKKILIVQSRTTPERIEGERENYRRVIGDRADIEFLSALDERLAWTTPDDFLEGADGVIFGGSSDFDFHGGRPEKDPIRLMSLLILSRNRSLVSYALAGGVPILGVCFGHQLIANMYGGEVNHDKEQSKFGSYEVQLTEEGTHDPLFKNLLNSFIAQYAHLDSVTKLPIGATLLASSHGCRFSALRYGNRAYTVQFHPEATHFEDLPLEYRDSSEASSIIPLWLENIVGRS